MTEKKSDEATATAPLPIPTPEEVPLNVTRKVEDKDGDKKADKGGDKTTVNVFEVLIERSNNEKIAAEVFEFEIPILRALHGEEAVRYNEDEPAYEADIDGDANSVLKMLQGKYNHATSGDVVSRIYRDADEFASKSGVSKAKGKAKGKVESENVDNRKKK